STRRGGVSAPPFETLNLGRSSGDRLELVEANRERLLRSLDLDPRRLATAGQVHGTTVTRVANPGLAPESAALFTTPPRRPARPARARRRPPCRFSPTPRAPARPPPRAGAAPPPECRRRRSPPCAPPPACPPPASPPTSAPAFAAAATRSATRSRPAF